MMDFIKYLFSLPHEQVIQAAVHSIFLVSNLYIGALIGKAGRLAAIKPKKVNIEKVILPPEFKNVPTITIQDIKDQRSEVVNFVTTLKKKLPDSCLKNMTYNVDYLRVKNKKRLLWLSIAGTYIPSANQIDLAKDSALYHELFHMASSNVDTRFDGFSQRIGSNWIGMGLNEGYTELLTRRYFPSADKKENKKKKKKQQENNYKSYDVEVGICRRLEKIVGADKMTEFYLNANLAGLVEELKKYSTSEEIESFIANVDLINQYGNEYSLYKVRAITKAIKAISNYLIKTHMRFLQVQLEEGKITEKQAYEMHKEFVESYGDFEQFLYRKYPTFKDRDIYNIYDELSQEQSLKR